MEIRINPRKKVIIASAVLYGISGIILFAIREDLIRVFNLRYDIGLILSLTTIGMSLFLFLYLYLQGNLFIGSSLYNRDYKSYSSEFEDEPIRDSSSKINDLEYQIANLESKISKYSFQKTAIDDVEKNNIINDIKSTIRDNLNKDLLDIIEKNYSNKLIESQKITLVVEDFKRIADRIIKEINALSRRANINLLIGSFTTVAALSVLIYWVFTNDSKFDDLTKLVSNYIPRITIIIFVELFAYFFLRLYKNNLNDIKYFQNELTNIESKFISLRSAITFKSDNSLDHVIINLSNTERNILAREHMTPEEIEKTRVESNKIAKLLEAINTSLKELKS